MGCMRTFLTGATGNVGRSVLKELVSRGHEVAALGRPGSQELLGSRLVPGHLGLAEDLASEVEQADGIIHLASPRTNDRRGVLHEDILGTGKLLDAWTNGNFVFASSQVVYGIPKDICREGSSPRSAGCWYDLAKIANEELLSFTPITGARRAAISIRMALLFDNGPRANDRQFLAPIIEACRMGITFTFESEEKIETAGSSFVGGEDLGRAFVDALGIEASGAYNVASGFCTWKELIRAIDRQLGTRSNLALRPGGNAAAPNEMRMPQSMSKLDTTAFEEATGFRPRQSLEELVARCVESEVSV